MQLHLTVVYAFFSTVHTRKNRYVVFIFRAISIYSWRKLEEVNIFPLRTVFILFNDTLTADPVHDRFCLLFGGDSVINSLHIPHSVTVIIPFIFCLGISCNETPGFFIPKTCMIGIINRFSQSGQNVIGYFVQVSGIISILACSPIKLPICRQYRCQALIYVHASCFQNIFKICKIHKSLIKIGIRMEIVFRHKRHIPVPVGNRHRDLIAYIFRSSVRIMPDKVRLIVQTSFRIIHLHIKIHCFASSCNIFFEIFDIIRIFVILTKGRNQQGRIVGMSCIISRMHIT